MSDLAATADAVTQPAAVPTCPTCGKQFASSNALGGHLATAHKAKEPCPHCGMEFSPGVGMGIHLSRSHGVHSPAKKRKECPECGKNIISKDMARHRRDVHGVRTVGQPSSKTPPPVKAPRRDKPLTAEQITRTACVMLWPDGVPSDRLEAVLRWHAETVAFLDLVQPASDR
jgi:uncharacterized C2H2 Zn-finger protein